MPPGRSLCAIQAVGPGCCSLGEGSTHNRTKRCAAIESRGPAVSSSCDYIDGCPNWLLCNVLKIEGSRGSNRDFRLDRLNSEGASVRSIPTISSFRCAVVRAGWRPAVPGLPARPDAAECRAFRTLGFRCSLDHAMSSFKPTIVIETHWVYFRKWRQTAIRPYLSMHRGRTLDRRRVKFSGSPLGGGLVAAP